MDNKHLYANLLIILQNFENLWNMYSISEGLIYRKETKESAKQFLALFNRVSYIDTKIRNSKELQINGKDSTAYIDELNNEIEEWVVSDKRFPIQSTQIGISDNENSRYYFQGLFMCLSAYLISKLDFEYRPVLCKSSGEEGLHYYNVKWKDRFPWQISDQVDTSLLSSLSASETVVIIGDIRKSQDLITYGIDPNDYRRRMESYIDSVKTLILRNMGIFDKFTGDGFVCYFNAYLSQMFRRDLYKAVIEVCTEIQKESKLLFEEWQQNLQKLSQESIGLSIGVDSGIMNFLDDNLIFAIGTPAVWATRMCSAGKAGDIIFNNIPHSKICSSNASLIFDEVFSTTKTGESFKAFKLRYEYDKSS